MHNNLMPSLRMRRCSRRRERLQSARDFMISDSLDDHYVCQSPSSVNLSFPAPKQTLAVAFVLYTRIRTGLVRLEIRCGMFLTRPHRTWPDIQPMLPLTLSVFEVARK